MFSFVTCLSGQRWKHPNKHIPLFKEAETAFGPADYTWQDHNDLYTWGGLSCDVAAEEVIWAAHHPDKELWLRMNAPADVKILDNR